MISAHFAFMAMSFHASWEVGSEDMNFGRLKHQIMGADVVYGFGGCNRPESFAGARCWSDASAAAGVDQSGCRRGVII
jgi:hypothetical protein